MGWGSVIGTVLGVAGSFVPGLGAVALPIGAAVGNAIDNKNASDKAAKQEIAGDERAAQAYAPFTSTGTQAFNTLAGLAGLGPMAGGGTGGTPQAPRAQPLPDTPGINWAMSAMDRAKARREDESQGARTMESLFRRAQAGDGGAGMPVSSYVAAQPPPPKNPDSPLADYFAQQA